MLFLWALNEQNGKTAFPTIKHRASPLKRFTGTVGASSVGPRAPSPAASRERPTVFLTMTFANIAGEGARGPSTKRPLLRELCYLCPIREA
jgi:hypothetical protein